MQQPQLIAIADYLIRLGLSLATAARGSDLPGVTTVGMLEQMVEGYGAALDNDLT